MSVVVENIFDVCVKTPKDEKPGTYATAACCKCNETVSVFASSGAGKLLPPEPICAKFRKLGWRVGKRKTQHVCKDCLTKDRAPKADPPPVATPAQRRAILDTLEIVFDPEKGFDDGYCDADIGIDMNVPRKWVEDIREEFIGPIPAPKVDPLDALLDGLSGVAKQGALYNATLRRSADDLSKALAGFVEQSNAATASFAELEDKLKAAKKERGK